MTLTVGSYETVSLDVDPYGDDTAVMLTLYDPTGVIVPLTEGLEVTAGTGSAVGTAHVEGVAGYDAPGAWIQVWVVTGTGAGVTHRRVYVSDGVPATGIAEPPPYSWPPTLEMLKRELKIDPEDTDGDFELAGYLASSISFVERVRGADFNFADESLSDLPDPGPDLVLGAIRLAGRWNARRRSPDAMVSSAELGTARVASFDPDIDRLLGIGRFAGPVFA